MKYDKHLHACFLERYILEVEDMDTLTDQWHMNQLPVVKVPLALFPKALELIGRVAHMPQVPVAHATGGSWPEGELGREVQTSDS